MFDLVGVGNLNTDTIVHVDYSILEKAGLKKGDDSGKEKYLLIEELLQDHPTQSMPGGCVANTIAGAQNLGLNCALSGIIGNDTAGRQYFKEIQKTGLAHKILIKEGKSANIYALITPDKERTFADNLGVADKYTKEDLPYEFVTKDCIFYTSIFEMEGKGKQAIEDLIKHAKKTGAKTAFELGSYRAVNKNRDYLLDLLRKEIDIVFCNEQESLALTEMKMNTSDSLDYLGQLCEIAAVTLGEQGAMIKNKEKTYSIPGYPAKIVDTTGAGDAFRAGFFYGLIKTGDIEKAGKIGCYYASKVVECIGARLDKKIECTDNNI